MPQLLVSVRSVAEADAALAGGADLIDVKEPRNGPLGRASDDVITAICQRVAGRRPVSAALGELADRQPPVIETRLAYCKWGLAGSLEDPHWEDRLLESARQQQQAAPGSEPVAVSYADWRSARAPQPDAVCSFVCRHQWSAFLIDTWNKDGKTLLDWLSVQEICRLCHRCHTAGIRVAIAGSLQRHHFVPLRDAGPDWFAVRGAACRAGMRGAAIDVGRVRDLARCVRTASVETSHGALSPGAPGDR